MPSFNTLRAVRHVQDVMPPGTKIRETRTGRICIIGVKFRNTDFWVMSLDQPTNALGLLHAVTIESCFEVVKETVHA